MTKPNPLPHVQLCGCGSCADAFEAALRDTERSLATGECAYWRLQVAFAQQLCAQLIMLEIGMTPHEAAQSVTRLATDSAEVLGAAGADESVRERIRNAVDAGDKLRKNRQ